jgi:hypothetical protein
MQYRKVWRENLECTGQYADDFLFLQTCYAAFLKRNAKAAAGISQNLRGLFSLSEIQGENAETRQL